MSDINERRELSSQRDSKFASEISNSSGDFSQNNNVSFSNQEPLTTNRTYKFSNPKSYRDNLQTTREEKRKAKLGLNATHSTLKSAGNAKKKNS